MTEREVKYIEDCHSMLRKIQCLEGDAGVKAVCINALSAHIREWLGIWTEPEVAHSQEGFVLIGLTFADLLQLQNGGTIHVPAGKERPPESPITIFLGGTDEHMRKGAENHPDTTFEFFNGHGDKQN